MKNITFKLSKILLLTSLLYFGQACVKLEEAARGSANIMPPLLEAMRAYATLGEVCTVLRRVFGEYR